MLASLGADGSTHSVSEPATIPQASANPSAKTVANSSEVVREIVA